MVTSIGFACASLCTRAPAFAQQSRATDSTSEPETGDERGIPAGFEVGVRTGYAVPLGGLDGNTDLGAALTGMVPLWLDAGYRLAHPNLFIGGYVSYGVAFINSGSTTGNSASGAAVAAFHACAASGASCSASVLMLGLQLQYHMSPESTFDPWFGAGFGTENVNASISVGSTSGSMGASGWDYLMLQAGADYHGSALFGVGPLLILGFGQYDTASASQGSNSGSSSIQNTALHEWLAIGLRGTFDFSEAPREDAEGSTAPASAASSRSDDQKAENDDARLLDQLQALCTDGRADACTALQFATAKRGCCTWHRGARKCDDQGQVVCMDGQISATCTCSAADLVSTSGASSPAVVSPAASSTVDSDRPLLQRLDTLCADAKAGACEALQFATQKRACCSAHQGARKCDADGHVVCMDGEVNASCSCSAANSATPPVAPTVPVDGKACKPPFTVDSVGHKHAKPGCGAAGQ